MVALYPLVGATPRLRSTTGAAGGKNRLPFRDAPLPQSGAPAEKPFQRNLPQLW
jgi:hypothetical protein